MVWRYVLMAASYDGSADVDAPPAHLHAAEPHPADALGQVRARAQPAVDDVETEQRPQPEQRRAGRPRLRLHRVRELDRGVRAVARESGEDLGQLVAELLRRREERLDEPRRLLVE